MRIMGLILVAVAVISVSIEARGQRAVLRAPNNQPANADGAGQRRREMSAEKPAGSHMSPAQQQNIDKLVADLSAIKQGSNVTQAQKDALKADLKAMSDGATRPDPALVEQLAGDLAEAMADGQMSNREKTKLTQDLYQVMNSANISTAEVNKAIADAQAILQSSGVSLSDVQAIANDLKAIASETQKNVPSASKRGQSASPERSRPRRP